jgi:E3 ubiquitin-protein ligase UBR7
LRQNLFACITCNPPPTDPNEPYTAAAVCYSCSISCHGEHTLVELFYKRNFVCDCGTTRMPSSSCCTLRDDPVTGKKGVHSQEAAPGNTYSQNFRNKFCGCGEQYDAFSEKGIMFQCLGLGTVETGGCGEDWWHPECLIGLPRNWNKAAPKLEGVGGDAAEDAADEEALPPGFPAEDDFQHLICYKCVDSNPWIKQYAGSTGFLPPVLKNGGLKKESNGFKNPSTPAVKPKVEENKAKASKSEEKKVEDSKLEESQAEDKPEDQKNSEPSKKRKADDEEPTEGEPITKRTKEEPSEEKQPTVKTAEDESKEVNNITTTTPAPKHKFLPKATPTESFSLFAISDFHDQLCRCADCFPKLVPHPQLREAEETYEPPVSEDGEADGAASAGTGSIYDRGEAALNSVDRVRAIEGAMAYNHLRDNLKAFLKPFAESGQAVSAEDIKGIFEKLRGDDKGIQDAADHASGNSGKDSDGNSRNEQSGM